MGILPVSLAFALQVPADESRQKTFTGHLNIGGRIVAIETFDKMTDRQIAAKIRQQFPK